MKKLLVFGIFFLFIQLGHTQPCIRYENDEFKNIHLQSTAYFCSKLETSAQELCLQLYKEIEKNYTQYYFKLTVFMGDWKFLRELAIKTQNTTIILHSSWEPHHNVQSNGEGVCEVLYFTTNLEEMRTLFNNTDTATIRAYGAEGRVDAIITENNLKAYKEFIDSNSSK